MTVRVPETDKDIRNVEAWAEIVAHLLFQVPPDQRAAVLALASQNEAADAQEREANGGFCESSVER